MSLILRWLLGACALYAIAFYYDGINIKSFYVALIIVLIFGLVNAILGTVLKILTLPINILTLGIGCLFINALMLWVTSTIVKGFEVAGFWQVFWVALIYSLVMTMVNWLIKK